MVRDEAFCFAYAETLEALTAAGAEPVPFSPVREPGPAGGGRRAVPARQHGAPRPGLKREHLHAAEYPGGCRGRPAHRGRVRRLPLPRPDAGRRGGRHLAHGGASCPGRESRSGGWSALATPPFGAGGQPALPAGNSSPCTSSTTGIPRKMARPLPPPRPMAGSGACGFANEHFMRGSRICTGRVRPCRAVRGRGRILPEQTRQFMSRSNTENPVGGHHPAGRGRPRGGSCPLGQPGKAAGRGLGSAGNHAVIRRRPHRERGAGSLQACRPLSSARTTAWWRRASARRTRA